LEVLPREAFHLEPPSGLLHCPRSVLGVGAIGDPLKMGNTALKALCFDNDSIGITDLLAKAPCNQDLAQFLQDVVQPVQSGLVLNCQTSRTLVSFGLG
jgi:hypothetical protein